VASTLRLGQTIENHRDLDVDPHPRLDGLETGPRAAAGWHGACAGAAILGAGAIALAAPGAGWPPFVGLLMLAAPGLAGLLPTAREQPLGRAALLGLWALASALGCVLTGGVTGPLAVWCLAPVAAAVVLGGGDLLAMGVALSFGALAATALGQALGLSSAIPIEAVKFALGLGSIAAFAAATFAAQIIGGRGKAARPTLDRQWPAPASAPTAPEDHATGTETALRERLQQQPHLILVLGEGGRVAEAFGIAPPYVTVEGLMAQGLLSLAEPARWRDLTTVLGHAAQTGQAGVEFPLAGAPDIWLGLDVRTMADGRLIAALRDATADMRQVRALETARADAEALNIGKSRFLANMSHELRTPLNAIMGFSDIMRERMFGPLTGKYGEYAELIHDAGSHLLDLINDVLDMSKIEAAKYELSREHLDAREPISAALRLMRLQADDVGVQLRGVLPSQPLEVLADRRALKQIVLNLISNALKFTPRGGLVTVSLSALAGAMELSVADTGLGIAEEDVARLGRPFEQAGDAGQQARGTGLGLSLVRAFAELHGGEMAIESRLGEGTAVTVRLPVLAEPGDNGSDRLDGFSYGEAHEEALTQPTAQVIAFSPQR
jgi:cell cycle sensor histidine kinase DivJ